MIQPSFGMAKLETIVLVSILTVVICAKNNEDFRYGMRFRGIECKADNISAIFKYCFLKPISRRHVALNIKFDIIKPVKRNIFLQVIINYRYGNVYRQVINTNRIDLCALMEGAVDNIFMKRAIPLFGEYAYVWHKCPYNGSIEMNNFVAVEADENSSNIFPQGYYRYDVLLFHNDREAVSIKLASEIKNELKESFG
jgi:Protein of unknown function (DUF1091)